MTSLERLGDEAEAFGIERSPAHERAVDVGAREKLSGVLFVDASAVKDGKTGGSLFTPMTSDERAKMCGDFLGRFGARGFARADRPDGLVGDGGELSGFETQENRDELALEHRFGAPRTAFPERFAHAQNRAQTRLRSASRLFENALVRVARFGASFRVTDDHPVDAGVGKHRGGHVARVGAVRVGAHVLGPEPNGFGKGGVKQRKVKRGRAHDRLHPLKGGREGREAFGPAPGVGERAVHLPVGDCERSPLHRMSLLVSGSESRGEKDESRYFSVTFVGGSEEIS